jgi:hypothetical protein
VPADQDKTPDAIADFKSLSKASAAASGTKHPAILLLQPPPKEGDLLGIRHDEGKDWWILRMAGSSAGKSGGPLRIEMVIAGHAAE